MGGGGKGPAGEPPSALWGPTTEKGDVRWSGAIVGGGHGLQEPEFRGQKPEKGKDTVAKATSWEHHPSTDICPLTPDPYAPRDRCRDGLSTDDRRPTTNDQRPTTEVPGKSSADRKPVCAVCPWLLYADPWLLNRRSLPSRERQRLFIHRVDAGRRGKKMAEARERRETVPRLEGFASGWVSQSGSDAVGFGSAEGGRNFRPKPNFFSERAGAGGRDGIGVAEQSPETPTRWRRARVARRGRLRHPPACFHWVTPA